MKLKKVERWGENKIKESKVSEKKCVDFLLKREMTLLLWNVAK